mmetsp:Transcript_28166/g.66914  ORF Transcript_28166/g.66914 Transcript_28166/m.66914 type:complete len:210 (+) Transcript_28166:108-737(+)
MLSLLNDPAHHLAGLHREVPIRHLPTQHHHVAAVQHSVRHVTGLCPSGEGLVLHGCQHLGGGHRHLASLLAALDHELLRHPNALDGDLHAQISSGHHDAVRLPQDGIEVPEAFHILDLCDDLGVTRAVLPAFQNVLCGLHKTEGDIMRAVRHRPIHNIVDLALADHRQVDPHPRHVHILLLPQPSVIQHLGVHPIATSPSHLENEGSIL